MKIILGDRAFQLLWENRPADWTGDTYRAVDELRRTRQRCNFGGFMYSAVCSAQVAQSLAGELSLIAARCSKRTDRIKCERAAKKLARLARRKGESDVDTH